MNSQKLNIYFMEDRIVFLANDFGGKNVIYSEILCERANRYYLEEPFIVG
jgi:hypothetical protein